MISFLLANAGTILCGALVLALLGSLTLYLIRSSAGKKEHGCLSCGGRCPGCAASGSSCHGGRDLSETADVCPDAPTGTASNGDDR